MLLALLAFTGSSMAQLVVYRLTFEVAGETINYRPYQSGYYIAPINGGTGSLILTLSTGGTKQFYTYASFGELFVAVKGSVRKTVFSATAANTVSTTTFYAIGSADDKIFIETRSAESQVFVAKELKGYAVSADSERDLPYASSSPNDIGVAGASYLRAIYDEGRTKDAIKNDRSLTDQVTIIQTELTEQGFINGLTTTTTTGGTTSSTGATGTSATTTAPPAATTSGSTSTTTR